MAKGPDRGSSKPGRGARSGTRVAGVVAIVILLLVDLVLVYLALTNGQADDRAGGNAAPASTPPPSVAPSDEDGEEEPAEEPEPELQVAVLSRILAPASATVAWRTTTGACDSPMLVQRTEDAGASWVDYPVQAEGAVSLLALSAVDESTVRAVAGVGEECEPVQLESFSAGEFWQPSIEPAAFWHAEPLKPGVVMGQNRASATPCEAVSALARRSSDAAAVACTDGSLVITSDAGETWADAGAGRGVVAVAATESGYTVAKAGVGGCEGLQIAFLAGDGPEPRACLPVDPSAPVVLTAGGGALWAWAGDETLISTDGGLTWA